MPEISPGKVLVRIEAAGICGSDLHFHRSGRRNEQPRFSGGHEIGAVVVTADPVDRGLPPGTPVAVDPLVACGACRHCSTGEQQLCRELVHLAVGFAEFAAVPHRNVHSLPAGLSSEDGAMADVVAVAVHGLRRVPLGQEGAAVVIGDGPLGLIISRLIASRRHRWLAVVGSHQHALSIARHWGADHVASYRESDIGDAVSEATSGFGADVVYECVGGDGGSLALAMRLVRPGGAIAVLGSFSPPSTVDLKVPLRKEINLRFCYSYDRREFAEAIELLAVGSIPTADLITHRFPLMEIQDAFAAALDRRTSRAIKVMVRGV
jgi:threonine dehydrogenase-like Zn-dependent dehydrogenase